MPIPTTAPSHQIIGIVAVVGVNLISDVWHRQGKIFWYFGGAYHILEQELENDGTFPGTRLSIIA